MLNFLQFFLAWKVGNAYICTLKYAKYLFNFIVNFIY